MAAHSRRRAQAEEAKQGNVLRPKLIYNLTRFPCQFLKPRLRRLQKKKIGDALHAGKKPRASKNKGIESKKKKKKKKKKQDADENVECEDVKSKDDGAKKQRFHRIWSYDDEVSIFKGMIEHGEKEGIDPAIVDKTSFYEVIRHSLQLDANKSQFTDKIKGLKKKYLTNLKKSYNGNDRIFSKDHDQKCFNLSKKIWGTESSAKVSRKVENIVEVAAAAADAAADAEPFCIGSRLEKKIEEYGSQLITGAKKLELDNVFRQLQVKEADVYLRHLNYMRGKTVLVLETLRSNIN
ncbi:probable transcription factor At4g01260 [Impatiens glandulifera]|uniref:probable transcription factor At4g01260 n=1 Tax=Impatiens glandulifera TaxID=253017 RepID=UPI001FB18A82|nr:probable transcription factor At4g01260 [Impatiens glandulifera]